MRRDSSLRNRGSPPAGSHPRQPTQEEESIAEDRTLTCVECGGEFPFTVSEQEFFSSRGFDNDPKRCPACRRKRRAKRRPADGQPSAGRPEREVKVRHVSPKAGGGPGERTSETKEPRPRHAAVCSLCGAETTVPFVPDGKRPIYCLACLKQTTR